MATITKNFFQLPYICIALSLSLSLSLSLLSLSLSLSQTLSLSNAFANFHNFPLFFSNKESQKSKKWCNDVVYAVIFSVPIYFVCIALFLSLAKKENMSIGVWLWSCSGAVILCGKLRSFTLTRDSQDTRWLHGWVWCALSIFNCWYNVSTVTYHQFRMVGCLFCGSPILNWW